MGGDYCEIVATYSVMTLNEFDNYILSIVNDLNYSSYNETIRDSQEIMPRNSLMEQRYYYYGNSNYLNAKSNIQYADGYNRYNVLEKTGFGLFSYPEFIPIKNGGNVYGSINL